MVCLGNVCAYCAVGGDSDECLLLAAQEGHNVCVLELLKTGADVNVKILNGETALMLALRGGDPKCVQNLIEAGADVNFKKSKR